MKTHFAVIILLTTQLLLAGCLDDSDSNDTQLPPEQSNGSTSSPANSTADEVLNVDTEGNTTISGSSLEVALAATPNDLLLNSAETEGVIWMREEEKLARDTYLALYKVTNLQIFSNIASSEASHAAAVKQLLDKYGIADPMIVDVEGQFSNPDLQALYGNLVNQGSASLTAALEVGAEIEDLDIYDLQTLSSETSNSDLLLVYSTLELGSRNHLRSFIRQLTANGGSYTPKYISQDAFNAIVESDTERGSSNGYATKGR
ncbi:MAG: DUF2202 domain-containing protein [Gammaproteobacteria bacterium]|nr:DUF2202 domain-containing protein [Gammaproteobacteria bacterium]